jgi:hypothetical protein
MTEIVRYTQIIGTDDGMSAFEDAELELTGQPLGEGLPPMFVGGLGPANGLAFVRFSAFPGEPHPASDPQWVVVLRGQIEVEVSDGTTRRFGPGELVLATDTSGAGHITRVVGDVACEALSIPNAVS